MTNEEALSSLLSEFARTMITDFPIAGILEHLVKRIVDVLPITSAGVTLLSEGTGPQYVAASDASALRFERVQTDLAHGPCLSAFVSGEAVSVPDLRNDDRFPLFAPLAIDAGLAAVFTFPLRHGTGCLGALDLYRQTPGPLDAHEMITAQTLADVAAAYLLNAQSREDAHLAARQLYHTTLHDPLTGLPNRLLLAERLEQAGRRARRSRSCTAVLFVDIDEFKQVNDTHGHHTGDALLVAVADRLAGAVRSSDTLARFSGDEFVFLCEDLRATTDAEVVAQRIGRSLARPFRVGGTDFFVTASVGIAVAGPDDEVSDQLVVNADLAMYQIKRKGGAGHQLIDVHEAQRSSADVQLRAELRVAFANDELHLAYQPIVRLADGATAGAEALLRWTHPTRGPVPASTMIRMAEQTGLILDIGLWALERACLDHATWPAGCDQLDLAVNVSVRQLLDPCFPTRVREVLERTGMEPTALVIEVTESILIENYGKCALVLDHLKRLGVRLALDDFGAGYSSLSYLDRLPIDILKIDRGFISNIGAAPASLTIAASISALAHDLGMTIVAEGVETQEQHDAVASLGCEQAQGYFYDRPMPARSIADHLCRQGGSTLIAMSSDGASC